MTIVGINYQNYNAFQYQSNADDPLLSHPEALFIFILSHGQSAGVILTDKIKQDKESTCSKNYNFETYTANDIWRNLAKLEFLDHCLKVLFLGVSFD
jgi:hypothetical protein